jgi:micrococcal nuclease
MKKLLVAIGVVLLLILFGYFFQNKKDNFSSQNKIIQSLPSEFSFCVPVKQVKVTDGDSLELELKDKETRIRLIGIDAPEMGQKPFGDQAKNNLKKIIDTSNAAQVCCKEGKEPLDRYGRTLAYCWAGKVFLNAQMVSDGQATSYFVGHKNSQYKNQFLALQGSAEENNLGIYNADNPLPEAPSSWRKLHRRH